MGNFVHTQNSFAAGEVSPAFFSREDINGLSKLENMDVLSSGALSRRPGLKYIETILDDTRLISFSVGEYENYLLGVSDLRIHVFKDGIKIASLISPWKKDDLKKLQFAQRFGTMIFVHPDYQPQILKKNSALFELGVFGFSSNPDMTLNIPFMKFDDAAGIKITITTHALGNNYATFTTDKDFFSANYVRGTILAIGLQWTVWEYISPRVIVVSTNGSYVKPSAPVSDWSEATFGTHRGWPCSISFHQNRLVFGGSRSWPSGVWMSRVGLHNNFNPGTGLDDEAIFITLLSQQRQEIGTVVSSDNLQIMTSAGEWAISNKPLTPASVNIKQHTSVGCITARYLPPQKMEGGTIFISANSHDIRELSLDELGENYNANDLCALSKHLMKNPIDMAYNDQTNQLFVIMDSGEIAVLNKNTGLGISAWGVYKTDGKFQSISVINGETFVSVLRANETRLEKFSKDSMFDSDKFSFSYFAAGLPLLATKHAPNKIKVYKLKARVLNTKSLFINGVRAALSNEIYTDSSPGFSGDISVNLLGTNFDTMKPLWSIGSNEPLPATVLSIMIQGRYSI